MPLYETTRGAIWAADQRKDGQPPLILVHGAGGSHLDWGAAVRKLGTVALDLHGHGKSPAQGRDSVAEYAADVVALLDVLGLERAVIGGHSMGGAIAQTVALEYPQRVQGLVLVGTGAKLSVHPDILDRVITHQAEVGALLKAWMWSPDAPDALRETGVQQFMAVDPRVVHGDYLACNRFDVRDRIAEISAPTLVIGGTADRMTPLKYSQFLAERIPNAQLVTLEGAGHMMLLEQAESAAAHIQAWLATL